MTRKEAQNRRAELELKRERLVDQLSECDMNSATVSSSGGSSSYTNRSVADLKAKIKFIEQEMARLDYMLGRGTNPAGIVPVVPVTII